MDYGLFTADLGEIIEGLHDFPEVKQSILFGSRAKGTYKRGSDVDIALQGKDITLETVAAIAFQLNKESTLPYFFDILHFDTLSDEDLLSHIKRVGQRIYRS